MNKFVRNILLLGILIILLVFAQRFIKTSKSDKKNNETSTEIKDFSNCDTVYSWDAEEFCFPKFDGLHNIKNDSLLMEEFQETLLPSNTYFAIYVDDFTYGLKDSISSISNIQVVNFNAMNSFKDKRVSSSDLVRVQYQQMVLLDNNWDLVKDEINNADTEISLDKPIFIEKYNETSNSNQIVYLLRYGVYNNVQIGILNNVIIKGKLFTICYYTPYVNQNSIDIAKGNNSFYVRKFIEVNHY